MDVLMFADTIRSPDLRHAIPLAVPDPFVYLERDGRHIAFMSSGEADRAKELELSGVEILAWETELGYDELVQHGLPYEAVQLELLARACQLVGLHAAAVPNDFPYAAASFLGERGVEAVIDRELFADRRRVKSAYELAGIRRAQAATEVAFAAIRDAVHGGGDISCESLRANARRAAAAADVLFVWMLVQHGPQSAILHEAGSGRIEPGEPVLVDLGVQDTLSGAWADMSRTFCLGDPPDELVGYHQICREILAEVTPMVRPGASCHTLQERADAKAAAAGYPTVLTKEPGTIFEDGYMGLGHGVGLEVHEPPTLFPHGEDLVAGDVITLEPGVYRRGFGGCRLEDLVLVTADGCEVLTDFPYDL